MANRARPTRVGTKKTGYPDAIYGHALPPRRVSRQRRARRFLQRRGGAASRDDLERTRRACEKFRHVPTSVISSLERRRFTQAKHDAQNSPFRHLLKPKAGGLAVALATLGEQFDALLDSLQPCAASEAA